MPHSIITGISGRQKIVLGIHGLMILILNKSFSGIIIASLLSNSVPPQINSLWDVLAQPDLKIVSDKGTYWYDDLMNHPATKKMEDRVETRPLLKKNPADVRQILKELSEGTHVLIGYNDTLIQLLHLVPDYFEDDFHNSDPISARPRAYGVPKKKTKVIERFTQGTYWLAAFGLYTEADEFNEKQMHSRGILQHHPNGTGKVNCPRLTQVERKAIAIEKAKLRAERKNTDKVSPLKLVHFHNIFTLLFLVLGLSVIAFAAEIIAAKLASKS